MFSNLIRDEILISAGSSFGAVTPFIRDYNKLTGNNVKYKLSKSALYVVVPESPSEVVRMMLDTEKWTKDYHAPGTHYLRHKDDGRIKIEKSKFTDGSYVSSVGTKE